VKLPSFAKKIDWEIELTAVIGRRAKDVSVGEALNYVAGYTIGNDLSARDAGPRAGMPAASPFSHDWVAHKNFEGACPLGPWIVPARDIPDPQKLGLKLWVNGELKQNSNTSNMIFNLAEQIAQVSARTGLRPGDMIMTGTPSGVGHERGEYLKAGDTVKLWIEGIGELTNTMG
jgi:2-keto-4-pentenoate hydratase/2-oxohepta-3-ene-1,7-dioic acid hydratase in catechol pathway